MSASARSFLRYMRNRFIPDVNLKSVILTPRDILEMSSQEKGGSTCCNPCGLGACAILSATGRDHREKMNTNTPVLNLTPALLCH